MRLKACISHNTWTNLTIKTLRWSFKKLKKKILSCAKFHRLIYQSLKNCRIFRRLPRSSKNWKVLSTCLCTARTRRLKNPWGVYNQTSPITWHLFVKVSFSNMTSVHFQIWRTGSGFLEYHLRTIRKPTRWWPKATLINSRTTRSCQCLLSLDTSSPRVIMETAVMQWRWVLLSLETCFDKMACSRKLILRKCWFPIVIKVRKTILLLLPQRIRRTVLLAIWDT